MTTMSEHTPGPWVFEDHGEGQALYSGRDAQHHGLNLCLVTQWDRDWHNNARLIAAAPELLEALQALYDEQNGAPLELHRDDWERAMEMASVAIAKARGVDDE
jgi:hypothetical protein